MKMSDFNDRVGRKTIALAILVIGLFVYLFMMSTLSGWKCPKPSVHYKPETHIARMLSGTDTLRLRLTYFDGKLTKVDLEPPWVVAKLNKDKRETKK
jgi:hypothetical protein